MALVNTQRLKRIAAIHDLSGLGKCSLTVALPVISASGVECACIPTALLSTHTGEFGGFTFRDLSDELLPIAEHWRSEGIAMDGIYTGYLASPEQEELLEKAIDVLADRDTLIITDPVMADNGAYYSKLDDRMCSAFRRLCARADIITPNITEASLLTGLPYREYPYEEGYIRSLLGGLADIGPRVVAITGVRPDGKTVGTVALDRRTGELSSAFRPLRDGMFYGTGDLFASSFAALIVRGADTQTALSAACSLVGESIDNTIKRASPRRLGVDFETALPGYIKTVAQIFGD